MVERRDLNDRSWWWPLGAEHLGGNLVNEVLIGDVPQVDRQFHDVGEVAAGRAKHLLDVFECLPGLLADAAPHPIHLFLRNMRMLVIGRDRSASGDEDELRTLDDERGNEGHFVFRLVFPGVYRRDLHMRFSCAMAPFDVRGGRGARNAFGTTVFPRLWECTARISSARSKPGWSAVAHSSRDIGS